MSRRCDGLLLVYSDPGGVPEPEFHHWYDDVHIPPRLQVPGVHAAYRYREADGAVPRWAALYPLRLDALRTDAYRAARERSPSESALIDRLATLDRRVYTRVDTGVHTAPAPAPFLLVVGLSSDDPDGLDQWYAEEHVPLLALVPGWLRTTRYRRTEGGVGRTIWRSTSCRAPRCSTSPRTGSPPVLRADRRSCGPSGAGSVGC